MNYYLFLDESGDHGLKNIDPNFPVFVLCGVIISDTDYQKLRQDFNAIKQVFWGDYKVIFHSRDIRKCDKEFKILLDTDIKSKFYKVLDKTISESKYSVISSVIDKQNYIKNTESYEEMYMKLLYPLLLSERFFTLILPERTLINFFL